MVYKIQRSQLRPAVRINRSQDAGLQESIAQYVSRARGIAADAGPIAVFNGSKQAIALAAQLLLNPADQVVMENPGAYFYFPRLSEDEMICGVSRMEKIGGAAPTPS
ncbi:aminotransferase class I/II-fold pyridoxal phosphate-dependent enzyme [Paenibacillus melissococcoides]|nr:MULTISPECIES: aminotransferase class I/II-fold pyridoxal phosphate-dependent enzyme [Paenibacillus]MEB9893318.1 aminotransferase class I/II-fold pyridoxal phosphate-dependent enzyme [Bacillus cereus]GIO76411.1 hypothetical protein J6TS7_00210 [Paenibacillus dendritiformis]CAH8704800.1 aminotransferase class I/II-fold pyridoxal phosphate-dependent enzyme [Paenibacillus melissococcoides]CAH8708025.1 aminotransferase class I/II-fold pyridoxal phosphate-dependent enzyme [Paenibacillus melissococ